MWNGKPFFGCFFLISKSGFFLFTIQRVKLLILNTKPNYHWIVCQYILQNDKWSGFPWISYWAKRFWSRANRRVFHVLLFIHSDSMDEKFLMIAIIKKTHWNTMVIQKCDIQHPCISVPHLISSHLGSMLMAATLHKYILRAEFSFWPSYCF